ncbi:MAG: two-component system, OmpR family, alkaline phosphatase synthesis response regulator PhoP [Chloroflexota bacterium]|nr:two-component system, OmpR family, alkaline phosphatase synthesis response regulator PhoP [Chloroflexota bacterium]
MSRKPAGTDVAVLLVEDDKTIADLYTLGLGSKGYRVLVASSGDQALKTMTTQHPDIVLLDQQLGGLNGLEVLARVTAEEPPGLTDIPVVIFSNWADDDLARRGRQLGAVDCVLKADVTPSMVATLIPMWIARWRRERPGN